MGVSKPRLLVADQSEQLAEEFRKLLKDDVELVGPEEPADDVQGVLVFGDAVKHSDDLQLCAQGFLDRVPDGLVLVDSQQKIVWHNQSFQKTVHSEQPLTGCSFLEVLGNPEPASAGSTSLSLPPDENTVLKSVLKIADRQFVAIRAGRLDLKIRNSEPQTLTSIVVRDVTEEILQNNKREAIYRAGIELADLSPEEVRQMSHRDRIDLLKDRILDYSQEILGFDTIEIRVLNPETKELVPLLEVGMQEDAARRHLYAEPEGNGVTGFVAATRTSYLCPDTEADTLYIAGAPGARSSLTVPLVMRDEVLGTLNVESPGINAFDQQDLEFLQVFGNVIANALNQLQLLVAEKMTAATESSDWLRSEVALPADEILITATAILEKYIGHEPEVCEKLQKIVANTRKIRSLISKVSEDVKDSEAAFAGGHLPRENYPGLRDKRILVVDKDESVLKSAHTLLERHHCYVEAVRSGTQACQMLRSHHYDVVLLEIDPPDMPGIDCFRSIRQINSHIPVIMMTSFGWDPGHTIVKARLEGGLAAALYKPFREAQLLTEVEKAVTKPPAVD